MQMQLFTCRLMLRNVFHTWVRELQQANAMLSFHSSPLTLESKADIPNLSHSAFSCWAIVVRGTNIEVVEPGVK